MAKKISVGMLSGVLLLLCIATIFLIGNFSNVGFASTWPVLLISVGICLFFAGYIELGLVFAGSFLIILLSNLEVIPSFAKSWPFILIWVAILIVFGYLRSRALNKKTS